MGHVVLTKSHATNLCIYIHPPQIIRQLPFSINKRLCRTFYNETIFESTKLEYLEALKKSGDKSSLRYIPKNTPGKKRNRYRNIIWCNPPLNEIHFQDPMTYIKYLTEI